MCQAPAQKLSIQQNFRSPFAGVQTVSDSLVFLLQLGSRKDCQLPASALLLCWLPQAQQLPVHHSCSIALHTTFSSGVLLLLQTLEARACTITWLLWSSITSANAACLLHHTYMHVRCISMGPDVKFCCMLVSYWIAQNAEFLVPKTGCDGTPFLHFCFWWLVPEGTPCGLVVVVSQGPCLPS